MKTIKIVLLLLISNLANSETILLSQGNINVTLDDIDGFAFKIPKERREGFFRSAQRVEDTLLTILNMKHINNYGKLNKLIDGKKLKENVYKKINEHQKAEGIKFSVIKALDESLVENFIKQEEMYKLVQKKIFSDIKTDDLESLAKEQYDVNYEKYIKPKSYSIKFISIVFNEGNEKEKKDYTNNLLNEFQTKKKSFNAEFKNFQKDNLNQGIELSDVKNFYYDKRYKKLSDYVFSIEEVGLVNSIFEFNSRYLILKIGSIIEPYQQKFEEVKESIINHLLNDIRERKFNNILISLTNDKVEVNEGNLKLLINRY